MKPFPRSGCFEKVNQDIPLEGINWFFDHAETISERSIDRIAALGGGIAVQHRMAYQGNISLSVMASVLQKPPHRIARMLEKGKSLSWYRCHPRCIL